MLSSLGTHPTLALIKAYKELESVFKNQKTKSQGWMRVSENLQTFNINKDPKTCRTKWHNLESWESWDKKKETGLGPTAIWARTQNYTQQHLILFIFHLNNN